jgi:hypothetical protein
MTRAYAGTFVPLPLTWPHSRLPHRLGCFVLCCRHANRHLEATNSAPAQKLKALMPRRSTAGAVEDSWEIFSSSVILLSSRSTVSCSSSESAVRTEHCNERHW